MTNIVYIATSIDGFIADADGGIEWLEDIPNPDHSDFGFSNFMAKIDAIVMGRKTFEKVLTFPEWPYTIPVFVLTNSNLQESPHLSGKVKFLRGQPGEIVETLSKKGYKNLYIDGGVTIQRFLEEDLIDELIITTIPVILGKGIHLFGNFQEKLQFTFNKSEVLGSSLVKNYYKRVREPIKGNKA